MGTQITAWRGWRSDMIYLCSKFGPTIDATEPQED